MINVFYYFLQSNALDFMQIVAFHAFDALIPNHVFRCILLVMLCKVKDFILKFDLFISTILPNIVF